MLGTSRPSEAQEGVQLDPLFQDAFDLSAQIVGGPLFLPSLEKSNHRDHKEHHLLAHEKRWKRNGHKAHGVPAMDEPTIAMGGGVMVAVAPELEAEVPSSDNPRHQLKGCPSGEIRERDPLGHWQCVF